MLAIRFQRTGRRNQPKFRVVVQDSRRTPTSGRVVANLGHYNPHTKEHGVDFDRLQTYLRHGAQPSARVVHLLVNHKIELPGWVKALPQRQRSTRHPDKLRRNRPAEAAVTEPAPESDDKTEEAPKPEDSDAPIIDNEESTPTKESSEQLTETDGESLEADIKVDDGEADKVDEADKTKAKDLPKDDDPDDPGTKVDADTVAKTKAKDLPKDDDPDDPGTKVDADTVAKTKAKDLPKDDDPDDPGTKVDADTVAKTKAKLKADAGAGPEGDNESLEPADSHSGSK